MLNCKCSPKKESKKETNMRGKWKESASQRELRTVFKGKTRWRTKVGIIKRKAENGQYEKQQKKKKKEKEIVREGKKNDKWERHDEQKKGGMKKSRLLGQRERKKNKERKEK